MEKTTVLYGSKKILTGIILSIFIMLAGVIINALLLLLTDFKMEHSPAVLIAFMSAACFAEGFMTAAAVGKKGLICGILSGLFVIIVFNTLFIIYTGIFPEYSIRLLILLVPMAAAAVGGIVGVSLKNR